MKFSGSVVAMTRMTMLKSMSETWSWWMMDGEEAEEVPVTIEHQPISSCECLKLLHGDMCQSYAREFITCSFASFIGHIYIHKPKPLI